MPKAPHPTEHEKNVPLARMLLPLASALLIAVMAGFAYFFLLQADTDLRADTLPLTKVAYMRPDSQVLPPVKKQGNTARVVMLFEEPDDHVPAITVHPLAIKEPAAAASASKKTLPKVAIIIDDMGYREKIGNAFLDMGMPFSFSFLPHAPHTKTLVARAREKGRDILMHLPLEPVDHRFDPGPGALYLDNYSEVLDKVLAWDLQAVPGAIGINNHMGSRFTADEHAMGILMKRIAPTGLFFVDSVTTSKSKGFTAARKAGVPRARRQVFLDYSLNKYKIKAQVDALINLARYQGSAIAIAHPHQETLDIIRIVKKRLQKEVLLTPVSALVSR